MNIFLPYANNIKESIGALDNVRLIKQILECKVLFDGAVSYSKGEVSNRYFRHPVAQFYKNNPKFLAYYGYECCVEYFYRFGKSHIYEDLFCDNEVWEICPNEENFIPPTYVPYYMEGSKGTPQCVRTTKNVSELFQAKLINKWLNDKKPPNWGKRGAPFFWLHYINLKKEYQKEYFDKIKEIKDDKKNGL